MTRLVEPTTEHDSSDADDAAVVSACGRLHWVHSSRRPCSGKAIDLEPKTTLMIGRGAGADIPIDDPRVSRAHVRIVWDGRVRAHRFSDLESANGTYVNGVRTEGGLLSRHDVLRVGDSLFVYDSCLEMERLERESARAAKASMPVLLLAETGSGKELLARRLHEQSGRTGKFVPVNCAALQKELAAAELFGHTRAAFSGATEARLGLFRAAQAGSLFLDEIGDLPLELQATLLRSLQERTIRPVGSDREIEVDVHVIAATHADLEQLVQLGTFREDLLARLQQVVLTIPPLRRRRAEILSLVAAFAPALEVSADAAEALLLWDWPRNIRELRAVVETFLTLEPESKMLGLADLARRNPQLAERVRKVEGAVKTPRAAPKGRSDLAELLKKHSGNVAAVARELKKPRSHVYRWMRAFGLQRSDGQR
jgi:DNA-binding NtrC family response regulator